MSSFTRRNEGRASRLYGGLGVALLVLHTSGVLEAYADFMFIVVGLGTIGAVLLGVRRFRPRLRWPWLIATFSLVVFVMSGAVRAILGTYGDLSPQRSIIPDLLTLPGYAMVAASLLGFIRARHLDRARDLDALLDSALVSLGALTVAWAFLMSPTLYADELTLKVRFSLVVYPPVSVFITALGVHLASSRGRRVVPAQRLMLLTAIGILTGDVLLTLGDAHVASVPILFGEIPHIATFITLACAALHPSMFDLTEPAPNVEQSAVRARLALTGLGLVLPVFVALANRNANGSAFVVLMVMVVLLTVVAVIRMLRALRDQAKAQARLRFEATHDALTSLPNRARAQARIESLLKADPPVSLTVVFVDLDRFKLVNDTGGHRLGDELLVATAQRLLEAVPPPSTVARIGGDEFLIVIPELQGPDAALQVGEDIRATFQKPFLLSGGEVFSSASLGLTHVAAAECEGREDLNAELLISDADTAMYRAKAAGRDGVAVFDSLMRDEVAERVALERALRRAVEKEELVVHFQPIVRLRDGQLEGFEALVRWQHHSRGLIGPDVFIPIAEESDLILEIGAWVLRESLQELAGWRDSSNDWSALYVAVNFSTRQLRDPDVALSVAAVLRETGVPPSALCVEMTESLLMKDPEVVATTLRSIRRLGVRLSIDDFGTGYSSLSYLHRFPVDYVKIDKSFVDALDTTDGVGANLVAAIIAMSGAMGMRTIAEGVETARQSRRLLEMGADRAQGYLYSRPLASSAIPRLLEHFGPTERASSSQPVSH